MTANARAKDKERCFQAGMNGYTTKPIDPGELFAALGDALGGAPSPVLVDASIKESESPSKGRPGLDFESGVRRIGGNVALYARLAQEMLETFSDVEDQLIAALTRGDLEGARGRAHSLKGVAGNVAAKALQQAAAALEASFAQACEDPTATASPGRFSAELASLRSALQLTRNDYARLKLRELQPTTPASSSPALDMGGIKARLTALRGLLAENTYVGMEALEELRRAIPGQDERARALMSAISDFDYEAALKQVEALFRELNIDPG
jgi:two-component system sensor histidine kinase/response regulator